MKNKIYNIDNIELANKIKESEYVSINKKKSISQNINIKNN